MQVILQITPQILKFIVNVFLSLCDMCHLVSVFYWNYKKSEQILETWN